MLEYFWFSLGSFFFKKKTLFLICRSFIVLALSMSYTRYRNIERVLAMSLTLLAKNLMIYLEIDIIARTKKNLSTLNKTYL